MQDTAQRWTRTETEDMCGSNDTIRVTYSKILCANDLSEAGWLPSDGNAMSGFG